MSSKIALDARRFWNAAVLMRRAPDRDQTTAQAILVRLTKSDFPPLRNRAQDILKEAQ